MRIQRVTATIVGLVLPLFAGQVQAAEIKVLASTAVKTVLEELEPQFEKATGNKVTFSVAPASVLKAKIDQGEWFDVAILTAPLTDKLAGEGKIETTRTTIAHAGIGVAIHKGASKPDISTTEAFKRSLLNAKSIGFTAGGASGAYLTTLFEKLGMAEQLKPKLKLLQGAAGQAVASDDVEIGMTQISEILPYANAELVGPLPSEIQSYTYFSAGVSVAGKDVEAAEAFIKFLVSPSAQEVKRYGAGLSVGRQPGHW
jgi:molybdate transport system substrate-binding protein